MSQLRTGRCGGLHVVLCTQQSPGHRPFCHHPLCHFSPIHTINSKNQLKIYSPKITSTTPPALSTLWWPPCNTNGHDSDVNQTQMNRIHMSFFFLFSKLSSPGVGKGSDSKYVQFYRPDGLCHKNTSLSLKLKSSH